MRLDTRSLALAGGVAAALAFALCTIAVAIAPGATMAFLSFVTHYDLTDRARDLTAGNFVGGLLAWAVFGAAFFALVGWFYNLARERRHAVLGPVPTTRQA